MSRSCSRAFRNLFVTYAVLAIAASILQLALGVLFGMWLRRDRFSGALAEANAPMLDGHMGSPEAPRPPLPLAEDLPRTEQCGSCEQTQDALERGAAGDAGRMSPSDAKPRGEPSSSEALSTSAPPSSGRSSVASPTLEGPLASESAPGAAAKQVALPPGPELTGAASRQPSGGVIPEPAIRGSDRRVFVRRCFPHKQFVAPYRGACLPSPNLFREVTCQDVSAAGFSFLASQVPDFESLVVALGVAPDVTYMTARVVNRIKIADDPAPLYRIGCRFSGRIS